MNRRDFMKTSAAAPLVVAVPDLAKAPVMPLLATPKTVEQLYNAINSLFESRGEFNKAYIHEKMEGWERRIYFKTYTSYGKPKEEGYAMEIDSFYNNPVDPVLAIWKMVLDFKADIRNNWTREETTDWESKGVTPGKLVWWRTRPELQETKNKLYSVWMRAEFA